MFFLIRASELAAQSPAVVFDAVPSTSRSLAVGLRPMPTPPDARMRNWSGPVEVKSVSVESAQTNVPW